MARRYEVTWRRGDRTVVVHGQGNTRRSAARSSIRKLREAAPDVDDLNGWSWTAEFVRPTPPRSTP